MPLAAEKQPLNCTLRCITMQHHVHHAPCSQIL